MELRLLKQFRLNSSCRHYNWLKHIQDAANSQSSDTPSNPMCSGCWWIIHLSYIFLYTSISLLYFHILSIYLDMFNIFYIYISIYFHMFPYISISFHVLIFFISIYIYIYKWQQRSRALLETCTPHGRTGSFSGSIKHISIGCLQLHDLVVHFGYHFGWFCMFLSSFFRAWNLYWFFLDFGKELGCIFDVSCWFSGSDTHLAKPWFLMTV